ncbi:hypothetical protein DPX39_040049400 [Trypanosoma brucei equiperdum]|uniref:Uncharacterized protein n=1 Tax=Trypanosoma brucei equiperdum TaxID=630700 RepID=A0A3L6L9P3_9TRYP|nr:hypothetical protein DPX39_040049400 [Trypanosoma brucei equiperdum]
MSWRPFLARTATLPTSRFTHGMSKLRSSLPLKLSQCGISFDGSGVGKGGATSADGDIRDSGVSGTSSSGDVASATAAAPSGEGWCYEEVDPTTGRTPLDILYDQRLQRIKAVFDSPLPPLPCDGSVNPDLLVGFSHYDYRLRDQYRGVVAQGLQVPVAAVRLSVAWSGRFDVSRFNRVQKVCGVCVDIKSLTTSGTAASGQYRVGDELCGKVEERGENEVRGELQHRIARFVRSVNERQSETLLRFQITQASEAVPDVEFVAAERELVAVECVQRWFRECILKPHLAVVIYGRNYNLSQGSYERGGSRSNNGNEAECDIYGRGPPGQFRCEEDVERQRAFIERKWLKAFAHRRIVPYVLSVDDLTSMMCTAVQNGEVESGLAVLQGRAAGCDNSSNEGHSSCSCADRSDAVTDTGECSAKDGSRPPLKLPLDDFHSWQRLLRKAVFRRHEEHAVFPVFFVHGEWAGGVEEMRYLLQNREAVDALLLHPNDIVFKKKFMSRLQKSHSRLRMAEEISD